MGVVTFFLGWEIGWHRDLKGCSPMSYRPGPGWGLSCDLSEPWVLLSNRDNSTLECLALDEFEGPPGVCHYDWIVNRREYE